MEEALTAYLLADAAVSAQIGTRLLWSVEPMTAAPYATLQLITQTGTYSTSARVRLEVARLQLDVWGETYLDAVHAGRVLRSALDACAGALLGGVTVQGCFVLDQQDGRGSVSGAERQLYRRRLDFEIHWQESET